MYNNENIRAVSICETLQYPSWLDKQSHIRYIELTKNTSTKEVDLFISSLFNYMEIDPANSANQGFKNLSLYLEKDDFVLSGGLLFFDNDNKIYPECCCGLENWVEIFDDINKKQSPWLGHDPFPIIEYEENIAKVWSDDFLGIWGNLKQKDELFCIQYNFEQLKHMRYVIQTDLKEFFMQPFFSRINELSTKSQYALVEKLMISLQIK